MRGDRVHVQLCEEIRKARREVIILSDDFFALSEIPLEVKESVRAAKDRGVQFFVLVGPEAGNLDWLQAELGRGVVRACATIGFESIVVDNTRVVYRNRTQDQEPQTCLEVHPRALRTAASLKDLFLLEEDHSRSREPARAVV